MGRKLPWKRVKDEQSSKPSPFALPSPHSVVPAVASSSRPTAASPSHAAHALKRRRNLNDSDQLRSPSTSPPPERPEEEYMRSGLSADDRYRMVEDELLHIAQKFTAHLHRAEYDRLKAVAKSQNAATIREIERPVVPGAALTQAAKRRQAELGKIKKQRALAGGDDGNEGTLPPETGLRGLLESPRKEMGIIRTHGAAMAKTRAAAGFRGRAETGSPLQKRSTTLAMAPRREESPSRPGQSPIMSRPEDDTEEPTSDEDDLGGPPMSRLPDTRRNTSRSMSCAAFSAQPPSHQSPASPLLPRSSAPITPSASTSTSKPAQSNEKSKEVETDDSDDEDDPFGITKRKLQRAKSREQVRNQSRQDNLQKTSHGTIPSFL